MALRYYLIYKMRTKTLIIDDHLLFTEGLNLLLSESGKFTVIGQVSDSRHALHNFLKLTPELVLVDYNMPYLNGLDVVKELMQQVHSCKVVVLSMYAERKDIEAFKSAGVNGYLTKTMPSQQIIDALCAVIDGEEIFETGQKEKSYIVNDLFSMKSKLSTRELEILREVKKGLTTEQIAQNINLSYYTVETHRRNIKKKLNFKSKKRFYDFLETI